MTERGPREPTKPFEPPAGSRGDDHESVRHSFRDARRSLTFADLLREHRRSRPHHTAVVDGDTRLAYAALDQRVNCLQNALGDLGVSAGDRILWLGQNSFRLLEILLAAAKIGAIFCPANWRQSAEELAFITEDLEPRLIVWQEEDLGDLARSVRDLEASSAAWIRHDAPNGEANEYESLLQSGADDDPEIPIDAAEPLLALYTAAFEGKPSAALLSHQALVVQNLVIGRMQDITDASVFLNSGPLFHVGTFMTTNAVVHHGGTNVFLRRSEPPEICRLIEHERCTHAFIMGPTLERIRELNATAEYDLSSLWGDRPPEDYVGGMVAPTTSPSSRQPGGFGQTETVGLTTFSGLGSPATGRAGRPVAAQVRIVDSSGVEMPAGAVGEIVVRGPTVMNGYYDRPWLSEHRARGGWHHTNDLGRRELDGSLTFVGPNTALIKSGAENIYPAEVEAAIAGHPAVIEVCVIGVPDERWTQAVKAVVVLDASRSATEEDLVEYCRERIGSYKKPRSIEFVDELPKTAGGTIDRDAVDDRFGGGGYPGDSPSR